MRLDTPFAGVVGLGVARQGSIQVRLDNDSTWLIYLFRIHKQSGLWYRVQLVDSTKNLWNSKCICPFPVFWTSSWHQNIIELARAFVNFWYFGHHLVIKNHWIGMGIHQFSVVWTSPWHQQIIELARIFFNFWYLGHHLVIKNHWISKGIHQFSVFWTLPAHQQIIELARAFVKSHYLRYHLRHHLVSKNHWISKVAFILGSACFLCICLMEITFSLQPEVAEILSLAERPDLEPSPRTEKPCPRAPELQNHGNTASWTQGHRKHTARHTPASDHLASSSRLALSGFSKKKSFCCVVT